MLIPTLQRHVLPLRLSIIIPTLHECVRTIDLAPPDVLLLRLLQQRLKIYFIFRSMLIIYIAAGEKIIAGIGLPVMRQTLARENRHNQIQRIKHLPPQSLTVNILIAFDAARSTHNYSR